MLILDAMNFLGTMNVITAKTKMHALGLFRETLLILCSLPLPSVIILASLYDKYLYSPLANSQFLGT